MNYITLEYWIGTKPKVELLPGKTTAYLRNILMLRKYHKFKNYIHAVTILSWAPHIPGYIIYNHISNLPMHSLNTGSPSSRCEEFVFFFNLYVWHSYCRHLPLHNDWVSLCELCLWPFSIWRCYVTTVWIYKGLYGEKTSVHILAKILIFLQ